MAIVGPRCSQTKETVRDRNGSSDNCRSSPEFANLPTKLAPDPLTPSVNPGFSGAGDKTSRPRARRKSTPSRSFERSAKKDPL